MEYLPTDLMINETESVDCGINDPCSITLRCNNKRFIIRLSRPPADPQNSVEAKYLDKLDSALKSGNDEAVDKTVEEISGYLAILCQPFFHKLAPNRQNESHIESLETCYNPEQYHFQMVTHDGKAKLIMQDHHQQPQSLNRSIRLPNPPVDYPIFRPTDIGVLEKSKGTRILKVMLHGRPMCCKMIDEWAFQSIDRELLCLHRISIADPDPSLLVPKVCGLVGSKGNILGFLMTFISPNPEAARMDLFDMDNVPLVRREKWANQIIGTVEQIHRIGVIWGDAKPENILVDESDNAWLVDFGGSWTAGWVAPEFAGTMHGDLQGLGKILEFLKVSNTLCS